MSTVEEKRLARQRGQSAARIALAVGLIGLGCYILQEFLRPLIWAGVLAIAVGPFYGRVRQRFGARRHDVMLPLLFTTATTLLFLVPLILVVMQLGHEAHAATEWLQRVRENGLPPPDWLGQVPVVHEQLLGWWQANLADPEGARALLGRFGRGDAMHYGREVGAALLHRAVQFCFTVLTLFFLFREGPGLADKMLYACRRLFGPDGEPVARQMVASIHGTVDGLVLVGLGIGAVLGIGYAVAGAPHPALLGGATAIAAVIPMGAPVVLALAAALVLAEGKALAAAILFAFGMAIIFVADHAIRPALIGGATRLPFLWVLLGILGGVETFGLLGLFLGPAVMAALILLWREWTGDARSATIDGRA